MPPFAGWVLALDPPPIAVLATYNALFGTFDVTYDRALFPAALAIGNWRLRWNNFLLPCVFANANALTVHGGTGVGVPDAGHNVIWYDATPPDVTSLAGIPAAPLVAFPIT